MVKILGLSGSLRAGSFNTALLRAASGLLPEGATLELATLHGVPLFDGDDEAKAGAPDAVRALKQRLLDSDALLIASPEYNGGVPGVLKNGIDWLSRPSTGFPNVLRDRPVALMGASPGGFGSLSAQLHWMPVFRSLGVRPWLGGQMLVSRANTVFGADGALQDEALRQQLATFLQGFVGFVKSA